MTALKIVQLLLTLANAVASVVQEKTLLSAGEAQATAKSLSALTARLGIADQVMAEVAALSDADLDADLRGDA